MIQQLIDAMDLAARTQLPAVVRHGLSELRPVTGGTAPHIYDGGSTWQAVAGDRGGSWSYWRLTAPVVEVDTDGPSCNDYFQVTYQLRLVTMVDRELCGAVQDAARGAASAIRGTDDDIRSALKLSRFGVDRVSIDMDSAKVYQAEFGQAGDVPPGKSLVALDVALTAVGKAHCFAPCEPVGSLLCLAIERATWQAIKACMSSTQLQVAEEDLCDPAPPCDPLTVNINGEEVDVIDDPCGGIARITVTQGGNEVGSLVDGVWVVPECPPCEDLNYSLINTEALELESGSVTDPCGATLNLVAPDATITFDGLEVLSAPSGATSNLDCGTLLDAAYVSDGGSVTGVYLVTGTLNGREVYTKDVDHNLEYTGTRWRLVKPGSDVDAALGSETYPWEADWSATSVTVEQATIGSYCGGDEVQCSDLTIAINGTTYGTVTDPCGATAPVDVHDSNGNDVGSLVSGAWVVAPPANVLREYTTGGTWNKPTSPSFRGVWVFAAGAGGAGGAGNVNVTNVTGGGGGGGGSISRLWIPAASLGLTETYAIGAGAVSVATGNGGAGGATLFGAHVEAKGGGGGTGGSTSAASVAAGAGGDAALNTPVVNGSSISGGRGGTGARANATATDVPAGIISGANLVGSSAAAPGGGGGCGVSAGVQQAGKAGGAAWSTTQTSGGAAGTAGGGSGGSGVSDIYINPFLGLIASTIGIGTGGGGGGGITTGTAGNGGTGGRAAGGGGGGGTGSGTRGASGAGGDGFIILYEVFAI